MLYLKKVDNNLHRQIKDELSIIAKDADWAQRYPMCSVWNTQDFSIQRAPILQDVITSKFKELYDYNVKHVSFWMNKYPYRSFQERHQHRDRHGRKVIVFNYFLIIPKDSGSFVADKTIIGDDKEGYVAFFDGMLEHEVTSNNSQEIRYTVSGNIIVQDTL